MERHRLDILSLLFGLSFAAVGLLLVGGRPAAIGGLPMAWIGPAVAIGLGLLLLYAARPQHSSQGEPGDKEEPA